MARGFRGVKDDLSEIGRHLLDVACFLSPLIAASANYTDSPPSSPHGEIPNPSPNSSNQSQQQQRSRVVAGALNDLAEFGGGLRSGIARLSSALKRTVVVNGGGNGGMREELVLFVRDLVMCPETWLEFPVPVNDHFDMSRHQRDHIATVERLAPSLATLRISLCPSFMSEESFWKIYFALLHPRLNKLESESLSTQQIVEEMRLNLKLKLQNRLNTEPQNAIAESSSSVTSEKQIDIRQEVMPVNLNLMAESSSSMMTEKAGDTQQEANQSQVRPTSSEATETTTLQYFDRWFDTPVVPREMDASTETRQQISSKSDDSYSEAEDGDNIVLLKKYGIAPLMKVVDQDYSLISSNERLRLSKRSYSEASSPEYETSDWHAVEDSSDYEMVDRS